MPTTITRRQAQVLRGVLRRAGLCKSRPVPLWLRGAVSPDALRLRVQTDELSIEYRLPSSKTASNFVVPLALLAAIEGKTHDPVQLEWLPQGETRAVWTDREVPQSRTFATPPKELPEFPEPPTRWSTADARLCPAFRAASDTAAAEATRYGMNCLQLSGEIGQIAATDALQLLVQRGFRFPWKESLLVLRSGIFAAPELGAAAVIEVGRTKTHVVLRAGDWTVWLRIETEARFPKVESIIPAETDSHTACWIKKEDREFLVDKLDRLPGSKDSSAPVTLDLNGHVAIRARSGEQPATELVLSRTQVKGPPIQAVMDRQFLKRAMTLGFERLEIRAADLPICCRGENRIYLWKGLDKDAVVPRSNAVTQIASSAKLASARDCPRQQSPSVVRPTRRTAEPRQPSTAKYAEALVGPPPSSASTVRERSHSGISSLREILRRMWSPSRKTGGH